MAPTSRSAPDRIFGPTIVIGNENTRVLVEQTTAVAPERLVDLDQIGTTHVSHEVEIDKALRLSLELD
jgi:mRNA interferase MazF